VLVAGCRSLLVPFAAGGEVEQTLRAERLQALGLAERLTEHDLAPATLALRVSRALGQPAPPRHRLALDGAAQVPRILRRMAAAET
jgi:predicted glycosyltransferase